MHDLVSKPSLPASPSFLSCEGEAADLIRQTDWSRTPIGAIEVWPQSLRTIVAALLRSRHPMFLWWGPSLTQLYNDAYIPSFGKGKHPAAMGQNGADCWQEIWPIIGPQIDDVMQRGIPSWHQDQLVPIFRNGRIEDVYWTYGYSAVLVENGDVGGTLVVCSETTERVVSARRQQTIRVLADRLSLASLDDDVPQLAMHALRGSAIDVPVAVYFEWRGRGEPPMMLATSDADDAPARADAMSEAIRSRLAQTPNDLQALTVGAPIHLAIVIEMQVPCASEPLTDLLLIPVRGAIDSQGAQFVAFGLNPRIPFGTDYRQFLIQLAVGILLATTRSDSARANRIHEDERGVLLDQAQSAVRAKDEFMALLGHDLRNPLASIVSALEVMNKRNDAAHQGERDVIQRQVGQLVRLVDDLTEMGRISRD